jgi:L-ascorbate metabolism protein UlaG (beta-lactamase superfamily)
VDLLLVSHNYYDHMALPTLREVRTRWAPCAVTGLGNARHLAKSGIRSAIELDWWQSTQFAGARVTYVLAQHFSSRDLHDLNQCLWGGFVIEAGGTVVYFAGDSGYCPHFADIGPRLPCIVLALLPIGGLRTAIAYAPELATSRSMPPHVKQDGINLASLLCESRLACAGGLPAARTVVIA